MRRRVGGLALLVWLPVALAPTSTATTGDPVTVRVSVASNGTEGNGEGFFGPPGPSMSSDGRFVAFDSAASNLVTADTNGRADVFVHDVLTRETTRVSLASDGTEADHLSAGPRISADGRIVAFESFADNLVPGDTNGSPDVFVHNRMTGRTTRVSVASDGTQANEGVPGGISISATGRFVAFESGSSTLVPVIRTAWSTSSSGIGSLARPHASASPQTARKRTERASVPPSAPTGSTSPSSRRRATLSLETRIASGISSSTTGRPAPPRA